MFAQLRADHCGPTYSYYLHVPFEETFARHATKPQAAEYGESEMRGWYRPLDLLPGGTEAVIGADSALSETVVRLMLESNLSGLPARDTAAGRTMGRLGTPRAASRTASGPDGRRGEADSPNACI